VFWSQDPLQPCQVLGAAQRSRAAPSTKLCACPLLYAPMMDIDQALRPYTIDELLQVREFPYCKDFGISYCVKLLYDSCEMAITF
jgi:hypothetical protein